jgi:hypothetical protein
MCIGVLVQQHTQFLGINHDLTRQFHDFWDHRRPEAEPWKQQWGPVMPKPCLTLR